MMGQAKANASIRDDLIGALAHIDTRALSMSRQIVLGESLVDIMTDPGKLAADYVFDFQGEIGPQHCYALALGWSLSLRLLGYDARPVFGGACWAVGPGDVDAVEFGYPSCDVSVGKFHAWVEVSGYILDPATRFFSGIMRAEIAAGRPFTLPLTDLRRFPTVLVHRLAGGFKNPIDQKTDYGRAHIYVAAPESQQTDMWNYLCDNCGSETGSRNFKATLDTCLNL